MANTCENIITVVGLKEDPEVFVRALSKGMFQIDLDNLDPKQWGEAPAIDGKTWYRGLVGQYREKGSYPFTYCILYPHKPYNRLGVTAPRFYLETKWEPPIDKLIEASEVFEDLTFHLSWWVLPDGPAGELVVKNGKVVEAARRLGSGYLFDWTILYPTVSLLAAHMPFTLAQRGALRFEDAINTIEDLRGILEDTRFTESPYQPYRDHANVEQTRKTLDGVLEQMQKAASQLNFEGVFVAEPGSQKEESVHRGESD